MRRPLPALSSLHGARLALQEGTRVRVFAHPGGEPVEVFRDRWCERPLRQPLTVPADGHLPGFARGQHVRIDAKRGRRTVGGTAHADSAARIARLPAPVRDGVVPTAVLACRPRRRPAVRGGMRASVMLTRVAVRALELGTAGLMLDLDIAPGPDSVALSIDTATFGATVQSPIAPVTFELDNYYGPSTGVLVDGFGVTSDGGVYWDPTGVDDGDDASVVLNPLTLNVSLQRKESAT